MIALLAIVGLLFLVWYLGKGLVKAGGWLERFGGALVDCSTALRRKPRPKIHARVEKPATDPEDEKFKDRVKKEIEELTK